VVLAASDAEQEALARELNSLLPLRVDDDRLLSRVVRSGRSEILPEVSPPVREAWSPTSRASEIVEQLAIASYMAVPLTIRGRVLGALTLTTSTSGRRFGPTDASLAEELARRAGVAMENAQLYRDAQNANRLKDDFLATVSHELRTPLTAMLAWIQVLRTGRPEQVTRAIDTIERNSQVQARIVDDILDVSSVITGKLRLQLELLQLDDILRAAIDTVRPMADAKGIELVASLEPAGQIAGDPARLQQIAWNLLSNAIKFTPKGGRVEVRLAWQSSNAQLSVIDNGQGIRADSLPHVFDRFWQGDSASTRVHGGLGMGLAIVRHLVELHGGHVSVESPGEGRGAKFTVVLPIRGLASMAAAASS
jgi:signal transduction histidine kinase